MSQNPVATTVTCGYIGGPPGSPSAQAVQFSFVDTAPAYNNPGSCVLAVPYWSVDGAGAVKQFVPAGGSLTATRGECYALVLLSAATWS